MAQIETMLFERHDNKYVPSWLKYRVGLCEYLAHEKRPMFSSLGKIYKFPPSCPMVVGIIDRRMVAKTRAKM